MSSSYVPGKIVTIMYDGLVKFSSSWKSFVFFIHILHVFLILATYEKKDKAAKLMAQLHACELQSYNFSNLLWGEGCVKGHNLPTETDRAISLPTEV